VVQQYNPPYSLPHVRRNEVSVDLEIGAGSPYASPPGASSGKRSWRVVTPTAAAAAPTPARSSSSGVVRGANGPGDEAPSQPAKADVDAPPGFVAGPPPMERSIFDEMAHAAQHAVDQATHSARKAVEPFLEQTPLGAALGGDQAADDTQGGIQGDQPDSAAAPAVVNGKRAPPTAVANGMRAPEPEGRAAALASPTAAEVRERRRRQLLRDLEEEVRLEKEGEDWSWPL